MDLKTVLDLDKILAPIARYAQSDIGAQKIMETTYFTNLQAAVLMQEKIIEADRYLAKNSCPQFPFTDISFIISRLKKEAIVNQAELFSILQFSNAIKVVANCHFAKGHLSQLQQQFVNIDPILMAIKKIINEQGEIKEDASAALFNISKQITRLNNQIDKEITAIAKNNTRYLQEAVPVMRHNLVVLAVKISYVNHFGGTIVDYSDSMQTAYVQPAAIAHLNKEYQQLLLQKEKEIIKILTAISTLLTKNIESIAANLQLLIIFDQLFAKALWGKKYVYPQLQAGASQIVSGYHLLLEQPVANSINIIPGQPIIISGPNAGGKSVLLKTIAIIFFLGQAGLAVPCHQAQLNVYQEIVIEMGDSQSISDSLSTFLAHLKALKYVIDHASANMLCLIDEIAKGTDPQEGEALALSIIEYLRKEEVSLIVTTHYPALRAYCLSGDKVFAGSMQFDDEHLAPTYHYIAGKAGSSYAFDLSKKAAIKEEIIKKAQAYHQNSLTNQQRQEQQLAKLINENHLLKEEQERQLALLKQEQERLLQLQASCKLEQQKIKATANEEIAFLIAEAIASIKEKSEQLNKSNFGLIKKQLQQLIMEEEQEEIINDEQVLNVGDYVLITNLKQSGQIQKITKNKALVDTGTLKINVYLDNLQKTGASKKNTVTFNQNITVGNIAPELNIIGLRREDASAELVSYLDKVKVAGIKEVRIIHGVGSGVLKQLVIATAKKMKLTVLEDKISLGGASIILL